MSKYLFHCPCDFKHEIRIDERFMGRRIPVKIYGYKGYILFPLIINDEDRGFRLTNPKIDGLIGEHECGSYSVSKLPNGKIIRHTKVLRLYILLNINEDITEKYNEQNMLVEEIEKLISKFIKCISIVHPSSIKWSYINEDSYINLIDTYRIIDTETNKDHGIAGCAIFDLGHEKNEVSITEFFNVCRNINKEISLQHTLLANVKNFYARSEYRETILNCATIIEKTLKEQIAKYLDSVNTVEIVKNQILESADGFRKILMVMKKFGLMVDNCNTIEERTIKVRNRIIHGGYFPTNEQALQAIEDAKLIIAQYNVPIFID